MPVHFEADFKNKTTYIQGAEDKSISVKGKNAFYDILQRMDEVVKFHVVITQDNLETARWSVDLQDGHFEHNGDIFYVHDQDIDGKPFVNPTGPFKLIFFRSRSEKANVTFNIQTKKVMKVEGATSEVKMYFIGWRTDTQNEPGIKKIIAIN